MNNHLEVAALESVPEFAGECGHGETETLEHLLRICEDATDAATRLAELLALDSDARAADVFCEISAERADFARRLAGLLAEHGKEGAIGGHGTFRGMLFRWRLQIAKHIPIGYRQADDRRFLLRLARRGSDLVTSTYAAAEGGQLGPACRREVHRQAEAVRTANHVVHQLAANA
jgi:hypothetical protein